VLLGWSAAALALIAGLTIGVWRAGGLDEEVLSEARLSLSYRWEYWSTTLRVIAGHPLFGVGPGNFRQHYLAFKPAGASDEILDPHNLILDAWANGGALGLLGVCLLIGVWLWRSCSPPKGDRASSPASASSLGLFVSGLLAAGLVLCEELVLEGFLDQQLLLLGGMWIGVLLFHRVGLPLGSSELGAAAAGGAVLIHLFGAGGIGMPAIQQLLLALTLLSAPLTAKAPQLQPAGTGRKISPHACLMAGGLAGMLACAWTGLVPMASSRVLMETARYELVANGRRNAAKTALAAAVQADSLAPQPRQELAMIEYLEWSEGREDRPEQFERAVELQQQAIHLDPYAAKRRLELARWWMERFRRTRNRQYAEECVAVCKEAAPLYPHHAPLRAELAMSLRATNDPAAAEEARTALRLDDLNRSRGHKDKFLPKWQRDWLGRIAVWTPPAP
jgi:hypothetical protein